MIWIAIGALLLLWIAQEWFYEVHWRRYGQWRSAAQRWFFASREERRAMGHAFTHRNADPQVERVRLASSALLGLAVVMLIAAFIGSLK